MLGFCVAEGIPALKPWTLSHCSFRQRRVMVECTCNTEENVQEAEAIIVTRNVGKRGIQG